MKTAIIINGHIRTWEKCKNNFLEAFGDLNADIFVSVYDQQFGYAKYIQDIQDFHEDNILSADQILSMFEGFNVKSFLIDNHESMMQQIENEKKDIKLVFNTEKHGEGIFNSVYPQYRKLYNIKNIIANYENENNFKYDRIIKTRTELIYDTELLKRCIKILGNDEFLIDGGNVTPNDVIFVTNRDNAFAVIDFMYNEFFNPVYPDESVSWPPHSILGQALSHNNINVMNRKFIVHVEREKLQQVY